MNSQAREQLVQAFSVRCGKTTLPSGVTATRYPTLIMTDQFTVKVTMVHPQLKHWHIQGVSTGTTEDEALNRAVGILVQLASQQLGVALLVAVSGNPPKLKVLE